MITKKTSTALGFLLPAAAIYLIFTIYPLFRGLWLSFTNSHGGPTADLDGSSIRRDWIGPENATAQLENGHLRRALYMAVIAHMLFLASLMGAIFWAGKLF